MITKTGDGLNILICTETCFHEDWLSFSSWHSIFKNLPDANVLIGSARKELTLSQWPHRCNVKVFQHKNFDALNKMYATAAVLNNKWLSQPLIVIDSKTMAIRPFSDEALDFLNNSNFSLNGPVWYFNNVDPEILIGAINNLTASDSGKDVNVEEVLMSIIGKPTINSELASECSVAEFSTFTYFKSKIANLNIEEWVSKQPTTPPFAFAKNYKTLEITVSQNKILDLWKQMGNLYESVR